ncbi:TnsA endonuclease C-terminal domain-containing protein [Vibrio metschnikovii]
MKNIRWLAPHMHSYDLDDSRRMFVFESILQMLDANREEKLPVVLSELDQKQGLERGTNLKYFAGILPHKTLSSGTCRITCTQA